MSRRLPSAPGAAGEKGAVMVLVAVLMVVLISFVALAVDVGYLYVAKNELQNAADGAALAAARWMGNNYKTMPYGAQQVYVCDGADAAAIRAVADEVGRQNRAAGAVVAIRAEDVQIGQWDGDTFTETAVQPDAVRVIARRDAAGNGPVATFFARVFGVESVPVNADAVAALTGQSTADEGELELPIAISRWFFDQAGNPEDWCDDDIKFYPTNDPDSCAGWTSWDYGSNDSTLRKILEEDPAYDNPETTAGQTDYNFTGGTLSNPTFDDLLSLFQRKGCDTDANWDFLPPGSTEETCLQDATGQPGVVPLYELDASGNPVLDHSGNPIRLQYPDGTPRNQHKWLTGVVVYDSGDCGNPNQSMTVVGFAEIEMRDVLDAPDKLVRGTVKCNYVGPGDERGGGGEYGVKGSIPGLVE